MNWEAVTGLWGDHFGIELAERRILGGGPFRDLNCEANFSSVGRPFTDLNWEVDYGLYGDHLGPGWEADFGLGRDHFMDYSIH